MASNSIAPSSKSIELYLDGSDWKVDLYEDDGTTQIASTTLGGLSINASSVVNISNGIDLVALGGAPAHELRIHGVGVIKLQFVETFDADFPISGLTVVDGEIIGQQVGNIVDIGSGITRVRIAWG